MMALILFIVLFITDFPPFIHAQEAGENATINGHLTDYYNGDPLFGIRIDAGEHHSWSDEDGQFLLEVPAGTYDLRLSSWGYQDLVFEGIILHENETLIIDTALDVKPLPPLEVVAHDMDGGSWVEVYWKAPSCIVSSGIIKDDDDADDFSLWQNAGSQNAVKFDSFTYPFVITGGEVFVGDSTFPGPFAGSSFDMCVYDDDGEDGLPGTLLGQTTVTVVNYGWVHFDGLKVAVYSGSVYLSMMQTAPAPESAPLGVDMDLPTYHWGYSKFEDNEWALSPYQDFMIRPWVAYPHDSIRESYFKLARMSILDPFADTLSGDYYDFIMINNYYYDDYAAPFIGSYTAYCVETRYSNGMESVCQPSNVAWIRRVQIDVNVTLSSGLPAYQTDIQLEGLTGQPDLFDSTGTNTSIFFEEAKIGKYNLSVSKPGYKNFVFENLKILTDTSFNVYLEEMLVPPSDLYVNSLTGVATWKEPAFWENTGMYICPYSEFQVFLNGDYVGSTTDTSFLISGLEDNTTYTAGVASSYASGLSDTSIYSFTYHYPFSPNDILSTIINEYDIHTRWSAPEHTAVLEGYVLYRKIEDGEFQELASTSEPAYTDNALPNGKYCYSVAAMYVNEDGSCMSEPTAETCQIISLGMDEENNQSISVSPNPFHDFLKLSFSDWIVQREVTVIITDLPGNAVYRKTVTSLPSNLILDLKNLQSGLYLLQVRGESILQSIKVIKI